MHCLCFLTHSTSFYTFIARNGHVTVTADSERDHDLIPQLQMLILKKIIQQKVVSRCFAQSCIVLNFSRTFMTNPENGSTPHPAGSPAVNWLNAVNPDLFTEQTIEYVNTSYNHISHTYSIMYTMLRMLIQTHAL